MPEEVEDDELPDFDPFAQPQKNENPGEEVLAATLQDPQQQRQQDVEDHEHVPECDPPSLPPVDNIEDSPRALVDEWVEKEDQVQKSLPSVRPQLHEDADEEVEEDEDEVFGNQHDPTLPTLPVIGPAFGECASCEYIQFTDELRSHYNFCEPQENWTPDRYADDEVEEHEEE